MASKASVIESEALRPAVLDAVASAALRDADEKIYVLQGVKVMLAQNLAQLYEVKTRALMPSVRRNIERFPSDLAFSLTNQDLAGFRSQFVISNDEKKGLGGARYATMALPSRVLRCFPAYSGAPGLLPSILKSLEPSSSCGAWLQSMKTSNAD